MTKNRTIAAFGIPLALAGLSYYVRDNKVYSIALLATGAVIIILPVLYKITLQLIVYPLISIIAKTGFRVFLKSEETLCCVKEIYSMGAMSGGQIHATHIFQQRVDPKNDVAFSILCKGVNNKLHFHRAFLFTNKMEEESWIKQFFEINSSELELEAYVWKNIALGISKSVVSLIPRMNMLLYKDKIGRHTLSLVGFEKVRSRNTFMTKNLNIGFCSSNKSIYNALRVYYDSIVKHPEMITIASIDAYLEQKPKFPLSSSEQFIIKDIADFGYSNNSVLHVGVFGSAALLLNGVTRYRRKITDLTPKNCTIAE